MHFFIKEPPFVRGQNRTNTCGGGNRVELLNILKFITPLIIISFITMND